MNTKIIDLIFELKSGCGEKEESIRSKLKISPAEFRGIIALSPKTVIPCKVLCSKMGLSPSRGSRVVEKLKKNGYLKEVISDGDRRIMNITLAPKGIKTREKIAFLLEDCEKKIIKSISRPEIDSLVNSLSKIIDVLVYN
jgi:DNA-binding MarR family transcriptional regulator